MSVPAASAPDLCEYGLCDGGGYIDRPGPTGGWISEPCRCLTARGLRWRAARAFGGAGVPPHFRRGLAGLDEDHDAAALAEARAYVKGWPAVRGLVLVGPRGAGKTTLAYGLANDLLAAGVDVVVRRTASILRRLRDGIALGDTSDVVEVLCEASLLVLDDLGAHQATEWATERLFEAIDERYAQERPMVVTTMAALDPEDGRWGGMCGAIARRLLDTCDVVTLEPPARGGWEDQP